MASEELGFIRQSSEHGGTSLAAIAGVNSAAVEALSALSIVDVEQLLSVASIEGVRDELEEVLDQAGANLEKTLATVKRALPQMASATPFGPMSVGPLGALKPTPEMQAEMAAAITVVPPPVALPASVNHISQMPPIRNQGGRGTCVAFALTGVHEFFRIRSGSPIDLSEQFLYDRTKLIDGSPGACGTWQVKAAQVLSSIGECREVVWPYNPSGPCNNNGTLPSNALADAASFKVQPIILNPNDVTAIKTALFGGSCVGFSIPVYNSWYQSAATYQSGLITMRIGNEPAVGGHAMCFVGYQDDPSAPGGGYFLLRNSWDGSFGTASPYGVGYGKIPYAYITQDCWEAVTIAGAASSWASLGGVITSNIAVARNADGRLEIFARGTDNALWHRWQTSPSNGWSSGWASLGGSITSDPVVGQNADGRLEVFARGTDNAVWHRWQTSPSNGWSAGWASLGGVITSNIAVARNADGRLEVFARGTDQAVWHRWQTSPSNGWSAGWASLGGVVTSDPVVGQNADGRLEVFARGTDNAVWHRWQTSPSNGWSAGWASLGGVITSNIAVARNADGRLEVFARGTDQAVWHRWQTSPSNGWSAGWASLGGVVTSDPVLGQNADGRLEVFARGTDNAVWHRWQTSPSNGWSAGWASLGGVITSNIAVGRNADYRMEIFVRGTDQAVWHRWQTSPSNGWN